MKGAIKQIAGIAAVSVVILGFISAEVAERMAPADEPIAIVRRFKTKVEVQNADTEKFLELDPKENLGELLYSGDSLLTDKSGYALVVFMDESTAKVKPNSLLIVQGERQRQVKSMNARINLKQGEVFLEIQPRANSDYEVATSRSLASVKGTKFGGTASGYIWVKEGQVDLTAINSGATVSLFDKMYGQVDDQGNVVDTGNLSDEDLNSLEDEYAPLDEEFEKKTIKFRFRDENGQIREIEIEVLEEEGGGQ